MAKLTIRIQRPAAPAWQGQADQEEAVERALTEAAEALPAYMAAWILQSNLFRVRSRALTSAQSWRAWAEGSTLHLGALLPYAYWLNSGVRPHAMTYLAERPPRLRRSRTGRFFEAQGPIGPMTGALGFGFRTPTLAAILAGAWYHPGLPATHFVDRAMEAFVGALDLPGVRWSVHYAHAA
jgi:hypothetical protein